MGRFSRFLLSVALVAGCGGGGGDDDGTDIDAGLGPIIEPGDPGAADVRIDVGPDNARGPMSTLI
jgi:hypothetical protein